VPFLVEAFDFPIPAISRDDGDVASLPLSFRALPEHPRRRERNPEDVCSHHAASGNFLENISVATQPAFAPELSPGCLTRDRIAKAWASGSLVNLEGNVPFCPRHYVDCFSRNGKCKSKPQHIQPAYGSAFRVLAIVGRRLQKVTATDCQISQLLNTPVSCIVQTGPKKRNDTIFSVSTAGFTSVPSQCSNSELYVDK
jgi:hypothetical protein